MYNLNELELKNFSKVRNSEYKATCCFCSDRGTHLYLDSKRGLFLCHRCLKTGHIELIAQRQGVKTPTFHFYLPESEQEKKENNWSSLTNAPVAIDNSYLLGRGLTNDIIKYFDLRELDNGIFVPFYKQGFITGGQIRYYERKIRYEEVGSFPGVYPLDNLVDDGRVLYLVEGVFGVFNLHRLGKRVITGLGASSTYGNYLKIIQRQKFIIAYDDDVAGREGISLIQRLTKNKSYGIMRAEMDNIKEL